MDEILDYEENNYTTFKITSYTKNVKQDQI